MSRLPVARADVASGVLCGVAVGATFASAWTAGRGDRIATPILLTLGVVAAVGALISAAIHETTDEQ